MSATINLQGPSTNPSEPLVSPAEINTAVNAALEANYTAAAMADTMYLSLAGGGNVSGATTFSGLAALSAGGSFAGTFSGTPTWSGQHTFSAGLVSTALLIGQGGLAAGSSTATSGGTLQLNAAVGNQRYTSVSTAGSLRMRFGLDGSAESGSNAGSNVFLNLYSDTGTLLGQPLVINRETQRLTLGSTTLSYSPTYSGTAPATANAALNVTMNPSGNTDGSAWVGYNNVNINSDTLDVGSGQQAIGLYWNQNFGGTGITGSRTGARFSMVQTGAAPAHANYQGGLFSLDVRNNSGGTDLWANAAGVCFGSGGYVNVNNGATFYRGATGVEFDYGIASGGSAAGINGMQVIRWSTHAFAPPIWENDTAITIGSQVGAMGAKIGFLVGQTTGDWPIDATNGRMFGSAFTNNFSTITPMQAAHGIDLYNVNLTGTQFRGRGFSVQGSGGSLTAGAVQVGGGILSSSSATVSLDTAGSICTAATISSGGANLIVGTPLIHDATGTLAVVSAVSSGVATAITLTVNTGFALTSALPSNPVTFRVSSPAPLNHPGAPTAPTLNLTWTASTTLNLQPSGGDIIAAKGSAGATTDTSGHLLIPFVSGTPTGVPANASKGIALRYDTSAHKLWAYDNGTSTWKGVALT